MQTINLKDQYIAELMVKIDARRAHYGISEIELMGIKLSILETSENYPDLDDFKQYLIDISEDNLFLKSLIQS